MALKSQIGKFIKLAKGPLLLSKYAALLRIVNDHFVEEYSKLF